MKAPVLIKIRKVGLKNGRILGINTSKDYAYTRDTLTVLGRSAAFELINPSTPYHLNNEDYDKVFVVLKNEAKYLNAPKLGIVVYVSLPDYYDLKALRSQFKGRSFTSQLDSLAKSINHALKTEGVTEDGITFQKYLMIKQREFIRTKQPLLDYYDITEIILVFTSDKINSSKGKKNLLQSLKKFLDITQKAFLGLAYLSLNYFFYYSLILTYSSF